MTDDFQTLLAKAKVSFAKHWESCEEADLPHTTANKDEIITALTKLALTVQSLGKPTNDHSVLEAIRIFYETIQLVNERHDGGLLETDERELIVPYVIQIAELAGVDPEKYDGEPGGEFRDF